ncbi:hypothetical protein, conserved [Leishmania tarentolae]|uniref:Uncharacterized protein n=1 Tax=Leishmania tarentolae TaxID=5689 RepID=A0A640K9Q6_LEITA|nr:hypothetical protein, conserved [Leishmania tarentolae]
MEEGALPAAPVTSSLPPHLRQDFRSTESASSGQDNVAHAPSTGSAIGSAAAPAWLGRRKLRSPSPPSPLGVLALSAQKANSEATATRLASAPPDPEEHSDVALTSHRPPVASSKSNAFSAPVNESADSAAACVSSGRRFTVSPASFSSVDVEASQAPVLLSGHSRGRGRGMNGTSSSRPTPDACVLPWWKRILVDAAYRQRLMQLSTEGYHDELRLLRDTPELLSSGAAMEARKVWRERLWVDDELERADLRPSRIDAVQRQVAGNKTGGLAAPIMEEVEEVVVMAQHVVFRVGHDELASHFSSKHPESIIDVSALASVQHVELGTMPLSKDMQEEQQQHQERAIKQHLAALRRFSRDTAYEIKELLARDIIAGRVDVPMQTAITDSVMNEQQGSLPVGGNNALTRRRFSRDLYVFPSPRKERRSAAAHHSEMRNGEFPDAVAPLLWQLPVRKPERPTTPLWQRPCLPPGSWSVEKARWDVVRAEALMRAPVVRDPLLENRMAAIKDSVETPRHHHGRPKAAEVATGAVAAATDGEQHRHSVWVRRQEAALACTDGTENLYGLQYVWRSPLPPGGFIRVSPDPRFAMWPDSADEDSNDGARSRTQRYDNSQGGGRHASDGNGIREGSHRGFSNCSTGTSQCHDRQARMRRLARRVNHRTRKLRWLHRIGRRHVCYNDLPLSDSDSSLAGTASAASSSSSSRCTSPTVSALRDINTAAKAKKACNTVEHLPLLPGKGNARGRQRRKRELVEDFSRGTRPVYDGALNINVYAEVIDSQSQNVSTAGMSPLRAGSKPQELRTSNETTAKRRFLGCYRQSRLLIHFKLYCRALYEEVRVRCGSPATHVIGRAGGHAPEYTPATEGPLAGVPAIPHPVLKLQEHAPSLRKPYAHRIPVASTMSGCRCWEGLYPVLGTNLATSAHQTWRQLRRSILVRQALRDIYDELPHDKEGLLDKRTFVLFVLQLLELFFPTRLPAATHIAIAEEEWVYRGTTEHVGPQTFHEKFFFFPFIFYRDIAAVTELQIVEFWTLVRICLDAQKRMQENAAWSRRPASPTKKRGDAPQPALFSLLTPLTHFTAEQLDILLAHPPPAFDAEVYDRYCLLRQAFRDDPKVRAAPRDHQYVVARSVVETQQQKRRRAGNWVAKKGNASRNMAASLTAYRAQLCSENAKRRSDIAAAAQRERESRQRSLEAQEQKARLEQSDYYQARISRIRSRAATAISGIESTCSAWELNRTDVYDPPQHDRNTDSQLRAQEDVEELLLAYLEDVPLDVFDSQVSLRERYLLHVGLQQERLKRTFSSSKPPPEPSPSVPLADDDGGTALPLVGPAARSTPPQRHRKTENVTQEYMAVMTGCRAASLRCMAVSEKSRHLLRGTSDTSGDAVTLPPTTSYAAGMYPLRALRRTVSSVLCPSRVPSYRKEGILNGSSEANLCGESAMSCSLSRVGSDGRVGAPSSLPSGYNAASASHVQHTCSPKTRGLLHAGAFSGISVCGVSGSCRGKDDAAQEAVVSRASHIGVRNKLLYRKPAAALSHHISRPATAAVSSTPPLPVSPLLKPRDASQLQQHQQLPTSAEAPSAAALAATWGPTVTFMHLGEEVTNSSPGSSHRAPQHGSTEAQDVGAQSPYPPRSTSSASLHYAQRLRAQKRRQEQYKRQFNKAAKKAAGVICNH